MINGKDSKALEVFSVSSFIATVFPIYFSGGDTFQIFMSFFLLQISRISSLSWIFSPYPWNLTISFSPPSLSLRLAWGFLTMSWEHILIWLIDTEKDRWDLTNVLRVDESWFSLKSSHEKMILILFSVNHDSKQSW